ncbi:MAG: hypothetical protein ABSH41_25285 [Syntrophobacteraceae bacterium]
MKRALIGLAMVCLIGCASQNAPQSPVEQNPLAAIDFMKNQMDKVHVGQSEAEVRELLGNCSNISRSVYASGESVFWSYTLPEIMIHCFPDEHTRTSIDQAIIVDKDPAMLSTPIRIKFNNGLVTEIHKSYQP